MQVFKPICCHTWWSNDLFWCGKHNLTEKGLCLKSVGHLACLLSRSSIWSGSLCSLPYAESGWTFMKIKNWKQSRGKKTFVAAFLPEALGFWRGIITTPGRLTVWSSGKTVGCLTCNPGHQACHHFRAKLLGVVQKESKLPAGRGAQANQGSYVAP